MPKLLSADVGVIGGGLAGLASAIRLAQHGYRVVLIEKKTYPFHRVCGEYISYEAQPFLESLGIRTADLGVADIRRLEVTAPSGRSLHAALPLGGFGISRYTLDWHLARLAQEAGVTLLQQERVTDVKANNSGTSYLQLASGGTLQVGLALGTYGKRDTLDRTLHRSYFTQPAPWVGVKYHVRLPFPTDLIALHNFPQGYCGISAIEEGKYCLCYLVRRQALRQAGSTEALEAQVVTQNRHLKKIWAEAEFLYERPETISEVSFARKGPQEGPLWMLGDAAGLIAPLCGNGMAMALHAARLATDVLLEANAYRRGHQPTAEQAQALRANYARRWQHTLARRMWVGRTVQRLFGHPVVTDLAVAGFRAAPGPLRWLIRQTHGQPF